MYFSDKLYESALADFKKNNEKCNNKLSFIGFYFKHVKLYQYRKKNYNSSVLEEYKTLRNEENTMSVFSQKDGEEQEIIKKAKKIFGDGFKDSDYLFLQEQYDDWTARNECTSKAQEELFKQLAFIQLDLLKARQQGDDIKDLTMTFQKTLDAGKLQPKQNSGDTTSETQTFGTLIEKWETTRPVDEPDEEFKDVDKIGLLIHTFYTGHIAKALSIKTSLTNLYDKFIGKYTVKKPEYNPDTDNEALFDSIFKGKNI